MTHRQLDFLERMATVVRQGLKLEEEQDIPKPNRYRLPARKRCRDGTESDLDEELPVESRDDEGYN